MKKGILLFASLVLSQSTQLMAFERDEILGINSQVTRYNQLPSFPEPSSDITNPSKTRLKVAALTGMTIACVHKLHLSRPIKIALDGTLIVGGLSYVYWHNKLLKGFDELWRWGKAILGTKSHP